MSTFDLNGKWFVHYAGYDKHIGFYPQPEGITAFQDKLKGYKTSKGTVQIISNTKLPLVFKRATCSSERRISFIFNAK